MKQKIVFEATPFGTLEFDAKDGLMQDYCIAVDGRALATTLYIWENCITEGNYADVLAFLQSVPALYRKARKVIEDGYETNAWIGSFIRDQIEALDEEVLLAYFDAEDAGEITPERFIEKLEPRMIWIAPVKEKGLDCTFDFSIDAEISDELLVISFDQTMVIDGIAQTYSGQFIYLPLAEFNRMTGQSEDNYSGVFSNEELPYEPGELAGVKDLKNMTNAMDELMAPMMMVVVGMTAVAVVISVIIIFLVTSLIIEENRASISLFKVFGYRGKEVKKLILSGSGPVVVAGFLLGVPVMLASANALYAYLGEMINLALPMVLSPLYVLISFVLIYGVYELTKLLCGRKLREIPMSEALKSGTE